MALTPFGITCADCMHLNLAVLLMSLVDDADCGADVDADADDDLIDYHSTHYWNVFEISDHSSSS